MNRDNHVHVKFFALFREMIGQREDWAELTPGLTVGALWEKYTAQARNPRVAFVRAAFAVNQRLAPADTVLKTGDEVGFLPPVSGGATRVVKASRPGRKSPRGKSRTHFKPITDKPLSLALLVS
ncbi:MAG TPA: MoaD/ThiS family protein, partial [Anaerolineae bacterium]